MTSNELLAKCSERDQAFYDHFNKHFDIKSFTELIDFDKVAFISLVDYHLVLLPVTTGIAIHTFTLEAIDYYKVLVFYEYLLDNIIEEPDLVLNYSITEIADIDSSFPIFQLTIKIG